MNEGRRWWRFCSGSSELSSPNRLDEYLVFFFKGVSVHSLTKTLASFKGSNFAHTTITMMLNACSLETIKYYLHMGWEVGLETLGPGVLLLGLLALLVLAALMIAVRIVFGVVAAVGLCKALGECWSKFGRLETRNCEPLTNCSQLLFLSWFTLRKELDFCLMSDWTLICGLTPDVWTRVRRAASCDRIAVRGTDEGRATGPESAGVDSALVRNFVMPLLLETPPRGTRSLLVCPRVGVFARWESSLTCGELAPCLSSASRSFFHLEQRLVAGRAVAGERLSYERRPLTSVWHSSISPTRG